MSRYYCLLILLLGAVTDLHAELYRWVDEYGKVHYSDKIPAQHKHRGHAKLNEQGVVVDKVASSLTPAQQQHRMQEKKLHLLREELQQQRRNKDQSLLDQFDSADDLIMARDGKIAKTERSINLMKKRADDIRKSLVIQQEQIEAIQAQGKSVPVDMIRKLLKLRRSVKKSDAEIAQEEVKRQQLHDQYTRDLQRYLYLKELDKYPASVSQEVAAKPLEGVITCSSRENCKPLWKRAVAYLKKHSDTPVKYQTDEIVITEPATRDQQTSLILSLIGEADGGGFSIYLDVLCRASVMRKPCNSQQAKSVSQGFRPALLNP
ncbi:MAG TPA: hypothetical protein DDW45_03015 [Gammaproteobacteria bacterium]|nr:hypothetical protein [Gammaproteobacteria bacterium]